MANIAVLAELQALQSCVALQHLRTTDFTHNSQFLPRTGFVGSSKFRSLPRVGPIGSGGFRLRANDGPLNRIPCNLKSTFRAWGWVSSLSDIHRLCNSVLLFLPEAPVEVAIVFDILRTGQIQRQA